MLNYCQEIQKLKEKLERIKFSYVFHAKNEDVDILAKLGHAISPMPPRVFLENLYVPTIYKKAKSPST
jgi:hypothetical protein